LSRFAAKNAREYTEHGCRDIPARLRGTRRAQKAFSFESGASTMVKQSAVFAIAALFIISGSVASAQVPTRDFPDAANPSAAPPAANNPRTGTPDRPPAAIMPEANAPDPATTGQAPVTSEKMQPEMDSVGGPKSPAGAERK
jgi:hypothetical protein